MNAPAPAQFRFDTWGTDQGLPHRNLPRVLQTRDGYLWMTTADGLARFDGVRFVVFNTSNTEGLKSARLSALAEGAGGSLWIGTGDASGLIRYKEGTFNTYTTADGLPSNSVIGVHADPAGDLILTDSGAARWRGGRFVPDDRLGLGNSFSYPPIIDNTGAVWVSDPNGLRRHTADGVTTFNDAPVLSVAAITAAYQDRQGVMWLGATERTDPRLGKAVQPGGLYRLAGGNVTFYTAKDGLPGRVVKTIYEDLDGNLWFGAWPGGLVRFADGRFITHTAADGIAGDDVYSITQDREGSLWMATNNGLTRVRKAVITTYSKENSLPYAKEKGSAAESIYPLYEDREGVIWIGAWHTGLIKYQNGTFSLVNRMGDLTSNLITSLFKDREGALWIGAYGGVTQLKDGKFTRYGVTDWPLGNPVWAITQDGAGHLWFGTGAGLSRFRDGSFTRFTTQDGLPSDDVRFLYQDRNGTLWVATYGGLASFKDGRFHSYTVKDGLSGDHVRCIYEDREGIIWIGTYDAGLTRLKDGKLTAYTVKDGLFDQGVFQILEDDRGHLWMSCNRGIYRVSRQELNEFAEGRRSSITSISFGKKDGMLDTECNGGTQPAGFKSRDGRLWFPTQKGIVVVDPEAPPRNTQPPPVVLEECLLDREAVDHHQGVEIPPGKEGLEIHYTGLSFIKPEQVRFKYKLEGLDRDWVDAGVRRSVNYSHLPPGEYTFRVIAANTDGVWNTEGAALRVVVQPPFWRTWWFLSLILVAFAVTLTLAHRLRVNHLKRAHVAQKSFSRRLLDSQEQERQRIAAELHDSLGQELLIIKNWALLGLSTTPAGDGQDQTRKQLSEISATASQAIEEVREIAYNLRPYQLDELGLSQAIEAMLSRVAQSSPIRFTAEIDPLDGLFSKEAEINFYRIVQECVNNIIKHARATRAGVSIKRAAQKDVRLIVWDNGIGFDPTATSPNADGRRGFGLTGLAERARMLGGKFLVHSAPGQGTTITLTLNPQDGQR